MPVMTYFFILLLLSDQDEVHERDRFSDFLLIALRDLLTVNRRLKLILMSATLNINLFIEYFGKCPVIHGRSIFIASLDPNLFFDHIILSTPSICKIPSGAAVSNDVLDRLLL